MARARNQISFEADSPEILERLLNAIWHVGRGLSVKRVMNAALLAAVEELERKHNKGKPFPQRESEIPRSTKKPKPGDQEDEA